MEVRPVFLILLDISGYTRFTRFHQASSIHAEKIIADLLERVISKSSYPLVIYELLGDEVTFFVDSQPIDEVAAEVRQQVAHIFRAFREREAQLISECSLCNCEACTTVGKLRLKAILHAGEAVIGQVGPFRKISGQDVILAHRLLKNSIPHDEYVLETEPFHRISHSSLFGTYESRVEHPPDLEPVTVFVAYPFGKDLPVTPAQVPVLRKLWRHVRIDVYHISRLLGRRRPAFANLEPPPDPPHSA